MRLASRSLHAAMTTRSIRNSALRQAFLYESSGSGDSITASIFCRRIGNGSNRLISPICSVSFLSREGRREYANKSKVTFNSSHEMTVMFIQHIYAAWSKLKSLATREVYNLAFSTEAIICLHVVPILQFHLGALFDCRIVEGETHPVGRDD